MDHSARDQVKEDLAQMGIKRGSIIWPLLATLVAVLLLAIYAHPSTTSPVVDLFKRACQGVAGQAIVETVKAPIARDCFADQPPEKLDGLTAKFADRTLGITDKWDIISELYGVDTNTLRNQKGQLFTLQEFWPLFVDGVRSYTDGVIRKFGGIIGDLATTAGIVGLISLLPGLAGMIYRRNFWGWFLPPFAVLFVITSGIVGQRTSEGALFIFLVSQLLIILLALRLQRYTRKTGILPAAVHNWSLAIGLALFAAAWWYNVGATYWSKVPSLYQWEFILVGLPVLYTLLRRSDAWRATTPKNIVICLDGTTNTPDQFESGRLAQTNVFKLFKMLKSDATNPLRTLAHAFNASLAKSYSDKQIAFYYSGVGNKFEYNPIVQTLGGVSGLGAASVVDRAYLDIVRVYRPGDRIFITGFSRGAAIARMLARAIDQRGAPTTIWTWRLLGRHWTIWQSRRANSPRVPITVLACFDTVGAFGIGKNIAGINFQKLDLFKDLTVPDNVEQAYHMVALDETREEFSPTLMDPDPVNPGRIVEIWFSGDHANIGGGWGTTRLSDLTLDFLLRRMSSGYAHTPGMVPGNEDWGVHLSAINATRLDPAEPAAAGAYVLNPDPLGQLRLWRSAVYVYTPRELPDHAVLSDTIFTRMTRAEPLYAPASLFNLHEKLSTKRDQVAAALVRLRQSQSVTDEEYQSIASFKDRLQLTRWQHDAGHTADQPKPEVILRNTVAA